MRGCMCDRTQYSTITQWQILGEGRQPPPFQNGGGSYQHGLWPYAVSVRPFVPRRWIRLPLEISWIRHCCHGIVLYKYSIWLLYPELWLTRPRRCYPCYSASDNMFTGVFSLCIIRKFNYICQYRLFICLQTILISMFIINRKQYRTLKNSAVDAEDAWPMYARPISMRLTKSLGWPTGNDW